MKHNIVKNLNGKTIMGVESRGCNCVKISFTDGTEYYIWAEPEGPLGLGVVLISDTINGKMFTIDETTNYWLNVGKVSV